MYLFKELPYEINLMIDEWRMKEFKEKAKKLVETVKIPYLYTRDQFIINHLEVELYDAIPCYESTEVYYCGPFTFTLFFDCWGRLVEIIRMMVKNGKLSYV